MNNADKTTYNSIIAGYSFYAFPMNIILHIDLEYMQKWSLCFYTAYYYFENSDVKK